MVGPGHANFWAGDALGSFASVASTIAWVVKVGIANMAVATLLDSPSMILLAIPSTVIWAYCAFGTVLIIGLVVIGLFGDWQRARGFDKLILLGPLFYAAPLAAFGTEHFTRATVIASLIPRWIPWHLFWAYFVGACFIAATLSMVTRIQLRLSASMLALTFFLFVMLMDIPGWLRHPNDRFGVTLALRELAFSGGALALAVTLTSQYQEHGKSIAASMGATIARFFVAASVLFYSFEQFRHGDHVPGVPLRPLTPAWIYGHALWTYLAALVYAAAGIPLLLGKKSRAAAAWIGLAVLFVELVVYVPIGVVERASLDKGFNFLGDTLMFCGAVLLVAGAMPREARLQKSTGHQLAVEAAVDHHT